MTGSKRLVLDANILLRAVLGVRVRYLIETFEDSVEFYSPDICFEDATKYISEIARTRHFDPAPGLLVLEQLTRVVEPLDRTLYAEQETPARLRIASRDTEDWPIVAAALLLDCPVWTEDQDFFGCGVATWTTRNIELYLLDISR